MFSLRSTEQTPYPATAPMLSAAPSQALHQTPLARLRNALPAPHHYPKARSSFKSPWAKLAGPLGQKSCCQPAPGPPALATPRLPGEEVQAPGKRSDHQAQHTGRTTGAEIREKPSYVKHKASTLLGLYTKACSRQGEHRVQGGVQAGHSQPEPKTSPQAGPHSPQMGEIPLGPSKRPCCKGQTSLLTQSTEEAGGWPLQPRLLPTSEQHNCRQRAARGGGLDKREQHRFSPRPSCPHGMAQSQAQIHHGRGVAASPIPGSTMHATPVGSGFSGHTVTPIPSMNQSILPATLWATRPSRFKGSSANLDRSS